MRAFLILNLKKQYLLIGFETWIGNVQVNTKSVHFYVQRSTKYRLDSGPGPITFDVNQLNVGGAMNLKTGEFTAPVDGIYHFEFTCLKARDPYDLVIYLRVRAKDPNITRVPYNIIYVASVPVVAATATSGLPSYSTGSLTASLKLKAGDVVNLHSQHRRDALHDNEGHYTQFAGWLVEEDLMVMA